MEKILFITAFLPEESAAAEKNTKIMLKDMSQYFNVDLIYFKYKNQDSYQPESNNILVKRVYENSLIKKIWNVLLCPFLHPYFSVRYNVNIKRNIDLLLIKNKYKAIVFDHSLLFKYAKEINTKIPKICISHDVMAQRAERSSNMLFAKFCLWSERRVLIMKNMHLFAFSQKDADLLFKYYKIHAGVSLDYIDEKIIHSHPNKLNNDYVLLANWKRSDNSDGAIWFFNNVIPLIHNKTHFIIIGKDFPKDKIMDNNPNVSFDYLGFVDDPYPLIANCRAIISPLFTGAGIKVKVMEAFACGTPVIGTSLAFEGFSEKYKDFMLLAQTSEEFVKAMESCEFSLDKRLEFKKIFINNYKSVTIPMYINSL